MLSLLPLLVLFLVSTVLLLLQNFIKEFKFINMGRIPELGKLLLQDYDIYDNER